MRIAAGHGTVFFLNGIRFLLGGLLLVPITRFRGAYTRKNLVYTGLAGLALFTAAAFQQAGLATTTAGNGGFITSLYVVIVPVLLWIFWGERPSLRLGIAVSLAVLGGFLLSTAGSFKINPGDLLVFAGAVFWAAHVVVVGRGQGKIPPLPFAFGQFLVCGLLNLLAGFFFECPTLSDMRFVLPAILYTALFSIALGFTLQVISQRYLPPADTALILSLEAVFAALFGWLLLHETLLPVQVLGCVLILAAVVLVQFEDGKIPQTELGRKP